MGISLTGGCTDKASPDTATPSSPSDTDSRDSDWGDSADSSIPDRGVWEVPDCTTQDPWLGVTFSHDKGASFTFIPDRSDKGDLTQLELLPTPNHIISVFEYELYSSEDAGCTWTPAEEHGWSNEESDNLRVTSSPWGDVLIWSYFGQNIARWNDGVLTPLSLPEGVTYNLGLVPHPQQEDTWFLIERDGDLFQTTNAVVDWHQIGHLPGENQHRLIHFEVDPTDGDRMLATTVYELKPAPGGPGGGGAELAILMFLTEDGGESWREVEGLDPATTYLYYFTFSPADPSVVWASGSPGRLYRSTDSGASFEDYSFPAWDSAGYAREVLFPHPVDPDILYLTEYLPDHPEGTHAPPGVTIHRFDASTREVTTHFHEDFDGGLLLRFSPADPDVMYVGATRTVW